MARARRAGASKKLRKPLQKQRVLRAAVKLADKHGLEALTMRSLGRKLGVEAMSLYNHVANKDDLLEGMLDWIAAEADPPSSSGEWRQVLRERAGATREMLKRHPWSARLLASRASLGPTVARQLERLLARLREAGFSNEQAWRAWQVVDSFVYGFALHERGLPLRISDVPVDPELYLPLADLPHLSDVLSDAARRGSAEAFEGGLALVLDGLARMRG